MQHTKCTSLLPNFNLMTVRRSLFVAMVGGQETNLSVSLKMQNLRCTAKWFVWSLPFRYQWIWKLQNRSDVRLWIGYTSDIHCFKIQILKCFDSLSGFLPDTAGFNAAMYVLIILGDTVLIFVIYFLICGLRLACIKLRETVSKLCSKKNKNHQDPWSAFRAEICKVISCWRTS
jgi:hypothetical protein